MLSSHFNKVSRFSSGGGKKEEKNSWRHFEDNPVLLPSSLIACCPFFSPRFRLWCRLLRNMSVFSVRVTTNSCHSRLFCFLSACALPHSSLSFHTQTEAHSHTLPPKLHYIFSSDEVLWRGVTCGTRTDYVVN